jgi:hypothetical protein
MKVVVFGPMFMKRLNTANPTNTRTRLSLPPPGRADVYASRPSPNAMARKPTICRLTWYTRLMMSRASAKPRTRKMSTTAAPFVDAMSSAMNGVTPGIVLAAAEMPIAAMIVGVKTPTPYVAMSIRNQGTVVRTVRLRSSRLKRRA